MISFPEGFFWGAATSSHQVEGNNTRNDWWEWEKAGKTREPSGEACRSYELFKEDFDLARSLHHNAHRLSIEWSRVEPEEGRFSSAELAHYREVVLALRERGLEPIVTLHHFTNPGWFACSGGWLNKKSAFYFSRYAGQVLTALGDSVRFWVTINEPLVYVYYSYILGTWPPGEKSFLKANRVTENLTRAHIAAYRLIHRLYKEKNLASPMVSIAKNVQAFETCRPTLKNRLAVALRHNLYNIRLLKKLTAHRALDYIGVNYYSRSLVDTKCWGLSHLLNDTCRDNCTPLKKNSLGWDVYPAGLTRILLSFKRFKLPVFILENGICTEDDNLRWEFIREHLKSLSIAMKQGVSCLGYIYWSLLDNYEWDKGFSPRFGLIEVDYRTYQRTVRESAKRFARICQSGVLEE